MCSLKKSPFTTCLLLLSLTMLSSCVQNPEDDYIPHHMEVYETSTKLDGKEAYQLIKEKKIKKAAQRFNHGLSENYFWILIPLDSHPNLRDVNYLKIQNVHIDTAICYLVRDGISTSIGMAGDKIPFKERQVQVPEPAFKLPSLNPGDQLLVLTDKQKGNNNFPMKFLSNPKFSYLQILHTFLYSLFFGAIILNFLIALGSGIVNKIPALVNYSFFVLTTLGFQLITSGYGFAFLYPDNPEISTYIRMLFTYLVLIFLLIFEYEFLEIKKTTTIRRIHFLIFSLIPLTIVLSLVFMKTLNQYGLWYVKYYFSFAISVNAWAIIAALLLRNRVGIKAKVFLLGHIGNITGWVLTILKDSTIIPVSNWWINTIVAGTAFELIIFNLAMILFARQINRERLSLSHDLNKTSQAMAKIKIQNKLLESQVKYAAAKTESLPAYTAPVEEIDYTTIAIIQTSGHYLHLYFHPASQKKKIVLREALKSFLPRLPEEVFLQSQRSYVVNRNFVKKIGANKIILNDGTEVPLSRVFRDKYWI